MSELVTITQPPQAVDLQPFWAAILSRFSEAAKTDTEPTDMAEAIRRVRERYTWTFHQMAQKVGTVAGHIYWMERGKFDKVTESQLLAYSHLARAAGLIKTAAFIAKYALGTVLTSRGTKRHA